jgi:Na+-driven multidrug efflux pump
LWKPKTLLRGIDGVADFANPDTEMKRILGLSVPLTLGAISNSIFYVITVAVVSHSIGTDSMAAFVLSSQLMEFSDELIGTIADAESSLCSHSLNVGNMYLTGQFVQLAISLHLIVFAAVMVFWLCCMDIVVEWLVVSSSIADIALAYTRIAVFQHLLQTFSRTITLLFHFVGNENFESQADICEGLGKVFVVAAVVLSKPGVTLQMVGWIQVITAVVALTAKLGYAFSRGWGSSFLKPFWTGLMGSLSFV